jgi:hypothetical protein
MTKPPAKKHLFRERFAWAIFDIAACGAAVLSRTHNCLEYNDFGLTPLTGRCKRCMRTWNKIQRRRELGLDTDYPGA